MNEIFSLLTTDRTDIFVGAAIVDEDHNAVIAGQTLTFNIKEKSSGLWWNIATTAFDLVAKPAAINAPQDGTTGIYEITLAGAYDETKFNYQVHIVAAGIIAQDFSVNGFLLSGAAGITSVLAAIGALGNGDAAIKDEMLNIKRDLKLLTAATERLKKGRL